MMSSVFGPPFSQKTQTLEVASALCTALNCGVLHVRRISQTAVDAVTVSHAEQIADTLLSSVRPFDVVCIDDAHAIPELDTLLFRLEQQSRRRGNTFHIVVSGVARDPVTGDLLPWAQAASVLGIVKEMTAPCSVCGRAGIHSSVHPDDVQKLRHAELLEHPTEWVPLCSDHWTASP